MTMMANLTSVLQPDGTHETTFSYDLAGRKTGMSDPDRGTEAYSYDPNGNVTETRRRARQQRDHLRRLRRPRPPALAQHGTPNTGQPAPATSSTAMTARQAATTG